MEATSILYQFVVGGVFFAFGIAIPWRAGDYSLKKSADRRLLFSIVAAALFYFALHSAWHLYAAGSG